MEATNIFDLNEITLYHSLLELKLVTAKDLDRCIQTQKKNPNQVLWSILVELGYTNEQMSLVILEHIQKTKKLHQPSSSSSHPNDFQSPEALANLIGHSVGKYKVVRLIAKGGMGFVYEGFDKVLERRVAIKILSPTLSSNLEYCHRFLREARVLAKIEHPNVIAIYDFGEILDTLYLVVKFVDGCSLKEFLVKKKLSYEEGIFLLCTIAEGLWEAHQQGVIHRDVKPENIMMEVNGKVLLTDFGIAHTAQSDLTQQGKSLGSPFYMAPEVLEGKEVTFTSDIYSLGVVAYFIFTGENPFKGKTSYEIIHQKLKGEYTPISKLVSLPKSMENFIDWLMKKDPKNRPSSIPEVLHALDEMNQNLDECQSQEKYRKYISPSISKKKQMIGIATVCSLLFLFCLLFFWGNDFFSNSNISNKLKSQKNIHLVLFEKIDSSAKKGQIENSIDLLEESKSQFSNLEKWKDKYTYLQSLRTQWVERFKKEDQNGLEYIKSEKILLAREIYKTFQILDISEIKGTLKSRFFQIRAIEKKHLYRFYKKSLHLIQKDNIKEAISLFESKGKELSPKIKKQWEQLFIQLFEHTKKKMRLFQGENPKKVLIWYNVFRDIPILSISSKAEILFSKQKKKVEKDFKKFIKYYHHSGEKEQKGYYDEAIALLKKSQISKIFRKIIQERILHLQKLQEEIPFGTRRVFGIYKSYISKLLISGNRSYFLNARLERFFISHFEVEDPICIWIKNQKILKIKKNKNASFLENIQQIRKKEKVLLFLDNKKLILFYQGHTQSDILVTENSTDHLFPKTFCISWEKVNKITFFQD